jgi:DNA repair protein RadC
MIMESTNENSLFEVAEIQLSYKSKVKPSLRPQVTSSRQCYEILKKYWDENKMELVEQCKVVLLNGSKKVIGLYEASSGTSTNTVVDLRSIFAAALKANAVAIILTHNHPSGTLSPSQADINVTKKAKEGGKLLDIDVLDHIIMTSESYYSFADEGLM